MSMKTDKKTFAVRDESRILIAFGILIIVLNFNQYISVYLFGILTSIIGFLNLFSIDPRIKFTGALDMVFTGVYFFIFALYLYSTRLGLLGTFLFTGMGLILLLLSVRFIIYLFNNDYL